MAAEQVVRRLYAVASGRSTAAAWRFRRGLSVVGQGIITLPLLVLVLGSDKSLQITSTVLVRRNT